ncbi:MAG: Ig-like domain-containing protein [Actinomycetia bacterium]|nr:Ig-like domain-containing protein [Actinomycetes bacterium]
MTDQTSSSRNPACSPRLWSRFRPGRRIASLAASAVIVALLSPAVPASAAGLDVTFLSRPSGSVASTSAAFAFRAVDASYYECRVDNALTGFTYCGGSTDGTETVDGLTAGGHTFEVRAVDGTGTPGTPAAASWTINGAPTVTVLAGPADNATITSPDVAFTFISGGVDFYECRFDDAPDFTYCGGSGNGTQAYPTLTDGTHIFRVRAIRGTDTGPTTTRTFTVASSLDTTILAGPAGGATITSPDVAFTFAAADASSYECRFDDAPDFTYCGGSGNGTQAYPTLTDGTHTFGVRAIRGTDAGPTTTRTFTVAADTGASLDVAIYGPSGSHPVSWAAWDFHAPGAQYYQCRFDSNNDGDWAYCYGTYLTSTLADGTHTLDVRAIDPSNNTGPTTSTTIDVSFAGNVTIYGPSGSHPVSWAAWDFHAPGAQYYQCRFDSNNDGDWANCYGTYLTSNLADGTHTLDVRAIDPSNNTGLPVSSIFVVSASLPDTTISTGPDPLVVTGSADFTFTSNEPGTFECRIDADPFAACDTPKSLNGLSDGDHTFEVRAVDVDANVDPTPAIWYWTVDSTKPTVTIIAQPTDPTTATNAALIWTSDDPIDTAECRLDSPDWIPCSNASQQTYDGLTTGPHTFSVRVTNTLGLTSDPDTASWTIQDAVNQPPVAGDSSVNVQADSVNNPINLADYAYDPEGDLLDFAVVTGTDHGTLTCPPNGNGSCTYTPVAGYVGDDSFTYSATDSANASAEGTITIHILPIPTPELFVSDTSGGEGDSGPTPLTFAVSLSTPVASDVTVDYDTSDGTATTADVDYVAAAGSVTIPAGESVATIDVTVNGDTTIEPNEDFAVTISTTSSVLITVDTATATIINDDELPPCDVHEALLKTGDPGTTDGALSVKVDGLGTFGSSAGTGGDAFFNPSGPRTSAATVFTSNLYLKSANQLLGDCFDGVPVTVLEQTDTTFKTQRDFGSLTLTLTQAISAGADSASLSQQYVWTNNGTTTTPITVLRHVDGDLYFDGTLTDGGAATQNGTRLYEYDQGDNPNAPSTYVGIEGALDGDATPSRWTIQRYNYRPTIVGNQGIPGTDNGLVHNDANNDLIVDSPYDVTLSQQWDGSVDAGASATFTTITGFGDQAANAAPKAIDDDAGLAEDSGSVNVDVSTNDSDPEGQAISTTVEIQPAHGSVSCTEAGVCAYTPAPDFNGNDSFTYRATDSLGASAVAVVRITVSPVNDAPGASDGAGNTAIGTAVELPIVGLVSDKETSDVDLTIEIGTVTGGSASVSGTKVTFTPASGFTGTATIPYTITDRGDPDNCAPASIACDTNSLSTSAQLTVEVSQDPLPPIADDESIVVNEDSAGNTVDVSIGDTDPNGDSLTFGIRSAASHGTASCSLVGLCSYAPVANYNGPDSFTYEVSDGNGGSDMGEVTVTVKPVNDSPVANDGNASTNMLVAVPINVSGLISDLETSDANLAPAVTSATHGTTSVSGTTVTFTPDIGFAGNATVNYRVEDRGDPDNCAGPPSNDCDPTVLSDSGAITITVQGPPVAVADPLTVNEDSASNLVNVATNDRDPNGDALSFALATTPGHGSANCTSIGGCTYTPTVNYNGPDAFTYTVSDGTGRSATGTVNVTVRPINDAPSANAGTATTPYLTTIDVPISALINDLETPKANLATTLGAVTGGSATVQPGQIIRFTPSNGFSGLATVSYTVADRGDPDNCARPASTTCDPTKKSAANTITVTVLSSANLTVTQKAVKSGQTTGITSTGLGDDFDVLITAKNTGGSTATGVSVTVRVPAAVRPGATPLPTVPSGCLWAGGTRTITCSLGDILPGSTATKPLPVDIAYSCDIVGNSLPNTLTGTAAGEIICGSGGKDIINGGGGNDTIFGYGYRAGNIGSPAPVTFSAATATWPGGGTASSGTATVTVSGADDDDTITTGSGTDHVISEEGDDKVSSGAGKDIIEGGTGNDRIEGGTGEDSIGGGDGQDDIGGGDGVDTVYAGDGRDTVFGGSGGDTIEGGINLDTIEGGTGDDRLGGGIGNDSIGGGDGNDEISGDDGADDIFAGEGDDLVYGGNDADTIGGGPSQLACVTTSAAHCDRDILFGEEGRDSIVGGEDHDYISGGDGNDTLEGAYGRDYVLGGSGKDQVDGGPARGSRSTAPYDHWNYLVGGSGPTDETKDTCSFGPGTGVNNTDYRAPSCELPSIGTGWSVPPPTPPGTYPPRLDRVASP